MRGRKPKPTRLRVIEGNPGHRPLNAKEPAVPAIRGAAAPAFLDPVARQEWSRQVKDLIPLGFVGPCDLGVLAAYCDAHSDFVRASQKLQKTGDLIVVKGKPITNPLLRIKRDARRDMIRAAAELGITPSSRSRVQTLGDDETEENPADEFFK